MKTLLLVVLAASIWSCSRDAEPVVPQPSTEIQLDPVPAKPKNVAKPFNPTVYYIRCNGVAESYAIPNNYVRVYIDGRTAGDDRGTLMYKGGDGSVNIIDYDVCSYTVNDYALL